VKIAAARILWHQVRARKFFSSQTYACHKLERRWQFLYIYMTQLQPIKKSFHLVSGANKFLAHTRNTWAEILVDVSVNVGIEVVKAFGVQKLQMFGYIVHFKCSNIFYSKAYIFISSCKVASLLSVYMLIEKRSNYFCPMNHELSTNLTITAWMDSKKICLVSLFSSIMIICKDCPELIEGIFRKWRIAKLVVDMEYLKLK